MRLLYKKKRLFSYNPKSLFSSVLPTFIHSKILMVKPTKNPAIHWSGCDDIKGLVRNGPMKNVNTE